MSLTITDAAASKIRDLVLEEKNPNLCLRLSITGGGCAGFQYNFCLDDALNDEDQVFEYKDAKIIIDSVSFSLLTNIIVDYQDDLSASMFVIKNPNATSSCGCGNSFSI